MALLANVARADGDVAEAEVAVIRKVALQMGLPPSDWDEVAASLQLTSSQAQLTEALMVLGLPPGATLAQAKSAFRNKIRDYHPDKYTNLPAEFREVAHRKGPELNKAWDTVRSTLNCSESGPICCR